MDSPRVAPGRTASPRPTGLPTAAGQIGRTAAKQQAAYT